MPRLVPDQWTLGALIKALEQRPKDQRIVFDFCRCQPVAVGSYRGFYEDLAIEFAEENHDMHVGELLTILRTSVGKIFVGYKGGEYRMTLETALWVANHGRTSDTIIVGIEDYEVETVLRTRWMGH